jgi:hypothetical protein
MDDVDFCWKTGFGYINGVDVKAGMTTKVDKRNAVRYQSLGYGSIGKTAHGRPYEFDEAAFAECAREIAATSPPEAKFYIPQRH